MTEQGVVALEAHPPAEEVEGYRDLSVIGRGATSWVYRSYQDRVRRWVALKVLQADGQGDAVAQRFDRERSLLAELGAHPHIVQVLDAGRTVAGRPYVAMDLCDGSVADRIEREGPLDWPEALDLMVKIAGATQAAHDLGVLHRDIKPQNILISKYGPMLADFGIARAKAALGATTGTLQMSPLYAAPEVFFGAAPPSEASDVYSLGASLYALLTGQTPFAGVSDDHVYDYLTRIQVEHPAAFGRTDLPGRLVEVVARAISADPARRQPDAGRFADELRACLDGRPLEAAVPSGPATGAPRPPAVPAPAGVRRPWTAPQVPSPEASGSHDLVAGEDDFSSGNAGSDDRSLFVPVQLGEIDGAVERRLLRRVGLLGRLRRVGATAPRQGRYGRDDRVGHDRDVAARPGGQPCSGPGLRARGSKRGLSSPPRPSTSGEPWRPAPAPPVWRRLAPAGVVALCVVGLLAVAVTVAVDGAERTSATKDGRLPSTTRPTDRSAVTPTTSVATTAPAPSGSVPSGSVPSGSVPSGSVPSGSVPSGSVPSGSVPSGSASRSEPEGAGAAGDPFPVLSHFGVRVPSDAERYRAIEAGHRRTLTAALGVDVPEAQTREVVAGGKVVGFVFVHPVPAIPPAVGDRWATVELPGSAPGSVAVAGPIDVRVAASGKNWVASWWAAPNGFVAVFGNEALLGSFLAEWEGA